MGFGTGGISIQVAKPEKPKEKEMVKGKCFWKFHKWKTTIQALTHRRKAHTYPFDMVNITLDVERICRRCRLVQHSMPQYMGGDIGYEQGDWSDGPLDGLDKERLIRFVEWKLINVATYE